MNHEREQVRTAMRSVVNSVGFNARGKTIHLMEVNSQGKEVKGHFFEESGMHQLASHLLNSMEPMDILTFTRRSLLGMGGNRFKRRRFN